MKRCYIHHIAIFTAFVVLAAMPAAAQPIAAPMPGADTLAQANGLPITNGQLPPLALPATPAPAATENPAALPITPATSVQPVVNTPSGLPSLPATNVATGSSVPPPSSAVEQPKDYSFGESNLSIMFLPAQINKMKEAIRTYEDSGGVTAAPTEVVQEVVVAPVEEKIEDPLTYPVFYLASIAYDGPGAWSLWLSGYKITATKNDTDITVLSVSPDSATFLWTPSFSKAMMRRKTENRFASTDLVKNRLAGLQRVTMDAAAGTVTFTLRQNQSFAVGYFNVFEGYVEGPTLVALPVISTNPAGGAVPLVASAPGDPGASDQAILSNFLSSRGIPNTSDAPFNAAPSPANLQGVPGNTNPNGARSPAGVPLTSNPLPAASGVQAVPSGSVSGTRPPPI